MNLAAAERNDSPRPDRTSAVGRNLMWMVWSGAVGIANSLLVWMFMAQMREPDELGRFTIVMGLYALFFGFCSLGLGPFLVSEISRRKESPSPDKSERRRTVASFIGSAAIFFLTAGIVCAVLMAAIGFWISDSPAVRNSTWILSAAMIPTTLIHLSECVAIAFGRTRLIALTTTLENLLRTLVPLALIWFDFGLPAICLSFVVVRMLALLFYGLVWSRRMASFSFDAGDFRRLAAAAPTFAATVVLASINWQAVIILLAQYSTEAESAKYGVVSRFLIPAAILMGSYAGVIQPALSQYAAAHDSPKKFGIYLSKMAGYPLLLATLAAVASPFLSRAVLTVCFGEQYAEAAPSLDILAMSVAPFCLVMVVSRGLVATGAQRVDLLANALGVAACFCAGYLLIPRYGATGAAIAQLISFLLMASVEVAYLTKRATGFKLWRAASVSSAGVLVVQIIFWNY